MTWHRDNDVSRRLATIPGIGPITASAIAATVPDASLFRSGRQFAAWLGLTPRAHSSGGKERLLGISKQGDGYIRCLLVIGATAVIRFARQGNVNKVWAAKLLERKPARLVSVALANKTARIAGRCSPAINPTWLRPYSRDPARPSGLARSSRSARVLRRDDKPVEPGIGQTLRVQALRARSSDLGPDPRTSSGPAASGAASKGRTYGYLMAQRHHRSSFLHQRGRPHMDPAAAVPSPPTPSAFNSTPWRTTWATSCGRWQCRRRRTRGH